MAKFTHCAYSADYLRDHPMPDLSLAEIERLTKMLRVVDGLTLRGHSWAYCARVLFIQGHLKLVQVDDKRTGNYNDPREVDLEDVESISTYDDLAEVHIDSDGGVLLRIQRSSASFRVERPWTRAYFHLQGDWWRLWHYGTTVASRLEEKLLHEAETLRLIEEANAAAKRRSEIAELLLNDKYPKEEE